MGNGINKQTRDGRRLLDIRSPLIIRGCRVEEASVELKDCERGGGMT